MQASTWQVLSRAECSLCEQMVAELVELLGDRAAHIQLVDIDEVPEFARKYASRIPVLLIDGEFVCAYRLDRERLAAYLDSNAVTR
jgi:hypothetical protein